MNLDQIQEMWERDATIDPDNLHDESLKIPQLHSKYYTIYNTITLLREKARTSYSKIKLERYNLFTPLNEIDEEVVKNSEIEIKRLQNELSLLVDET